MKAKRLFAAAMVTMVATSARASVEINASPTKNMNCVGGNCSPTAKNAVLNTTDLARMLTTGDVKVVTVNGAVTITVSGPLSWTSTHRLTLDANLNVSFRARVEVTGRGAVTIITNDGGTGGDLIFFYGGKLDFWDTSANLMINGTQYQLVSDIPSIASAYANAPNNYAILALTKDYNAAPDGTYEGSAVPTNMEGVFEGLGHTISNFSANTTGTAAGFFLESAVLDDSTIRDLTLSNANIVGGDNSRVGVLGGALESNIINVHASGSVTGGDDSYIGGLAGIGGAFLKSDSSASVTCARRCYGGGLAGSGGQFTLSRASGTITVVSGLAGGLVGLLTSQGRVSQSFATGDVTSVKRQRRVTIGGLIGIADQDTSIENSYSQSAIRNDGVGPLGGLTGYAKADTDVTTSYATGHIGIEGARTKVTDGVGGFVGSVQIPVQFRLDYWDTDTSGTDLGCGASKPAHRCPPIDGLTDVQLKSSLPTGFDPSIWAQSPTINNGYPYLIANPPPQ